MQWGAGPLAESSAPRQQRTHIPCLSSQAPGACDAGGRCGRPRRRSTTVRRDRDEGCEGFTEALVVRDGNPRGRRSRGGGGPRLARPGGARRRDLPLPIPPGRAAARATRPVPLRPSPRPRTAFGRARRSLRWSRENVRSHSRSPPTETRSTVPGTRSPTSPTSPARSRSAPGRLPRRASTRPSWRTACSSRCESSG